MPKRKAGFDVDRLGTWYTPSKSAKRNAVDQVAKIMAPRSSVTGSQARDTVMAKALSKAPKVGNRLFSRKRPYKPRGRKRGGGGSINSDADMIAQGYIKNPKGQWIKSPFKQNLKTNPEVYVPDDGRSAWSKDAEDFWGGFKQGFDNVIGIGKKIPILSDYAQYIPTLGDGIHKRRKRGGDMDNAQVLKNLYQQRERQTMASQEEARRNSPEARKMSEEEEMRKATDAAVKALPEDVRKRWDEKIYHNQGEVKTGQDLFKRFGMPFWDDWVEQQKAEGKKPTEFGYRADRAQRQMAQKERNERNSGISGFFKGVVDAFAHAGPQALADAVNIIGRVMPGASIITDKIEDQLNPNHEKHSWELLGGPAETIINGAVNVAGKAAAGAGVDKVRRLLAQETKVTNMRGTGVHHSIRDIKLDPALRDSVAMVTGNTPLDPHSSNSLENLKHHHINHIKNLVHRRVAGLNPRRKLTKGGRTFTTLRNILVSPDAAP